MPSEIIAPSPRYQVPDPLDLKIGKMFDKWIRRLRLRDWDVRWLIVRRKDFPEHKSGVCESIVTKKIARIKILHPDDQDPEWIDGYDVELTVVHELLHLHLSPWSLLFEDEDQALLLLEQTVHALSTTLLEADRGDRNWTNLPEFCSVQDPHSMLR